MHRAGQQWSCQLEEDYLKNKFKTAVRNMHKVGAHVRWIWSDVWMSLFYYCVNQLLICNEYVYVSGHDLVNTRTAVCKSSQSFLGLIQECVAYSRSALHLILEPTTANL